MSTDIVPRTQNTGILGYQFVHIPKDGLDVLEVQKHRAEAELAVMTAQVLTNRRPYYIKWDEWTNRPDLANGVIVYHIQIVIAFIDASDALVGDIVYSPRHEKQYQDHKCEVLRDGVSGPTYKRLLKNLWTRIE